MFRRRRLACQQVVELVTEYLDGAMEPRRRARFEAHLAACDGCSNYLEQFRTTVAVAGRLGPALSGLVSRHRSVVDLTADRPLKHGRVNEG